MLTTTKSVNFGSRRAGLSTVGVAVHNADGTVLTARTTAGISEIISSTGLYTKQFTLDNEFIGILVWDTGEATPLYAIEDFDNRELSVGSIVAVTPNGKDSVWTEAEKKKLLNDVKKLLRVVSKITNKEVVEAIKNIPQQDFLPLVEAIKSARDGDKGKLEAVMEALTVLIEHKEIEGVIKEVEEDVNNTIVEAESGSSKG